MKRFGANESHRRIACSNSQGGAKPLPNHQEIQIMATLRSTYSSFWNEHTTMKIQHMVHTKQQGRSKEGGWGRVAD